MRNSRVNYKAMKLFDSHAHINEDRFSPQDRAELAIEIENSKLAFVADIGYDLNSSIQAAENAAEYPWCVAAVGCHPHDARNMTEDWYEAINSLASGERVKAIGEIGLDYHYMRSEKDDQRYWFRRQIRLANELGMPIVIHSREADRETLDILLEEGAFSDERKKKFSKRPGEEGFLIPDARVDIHCFSGSAELAQEYVKHGATIGICGPVTYKNNKKTVRVVEETPLEFIMIETDFPYLTPEPMRGRPNKPWYVEYTAEKVAEIKGISVEDVAEITYENAVRFYGIK